MDNEELLLAQAAQIKARSPDVHVWVYRNLVHPQSW